MADYEKVLRAVQAIDPANIGEKTGSAIVTAIDARAPEAPALFPISEYHEDIGPVLWWKFPIEEAPYVGSPLDTGYPVQMIAHGIEPSPTFFVGGWPGYHTHFSLISIPASPRT